MAKRSAGILLYRFAGAKLQVFLIHPGGPFFRNKDAGSWSIPKGEFTNGEMPLEAARREFTEETGQTINGNFLPLSPVIQKGGKTVYAWCIEGDIDEQSIASNMFEMEWPPKSGNMQTFPEVDKAGWFDIETAKKKINLAQVDLVSELARKIIN